jgi:hypothetical protein
MASEVKRNNWTRYLRRFNETNRFRPVRVRVKRRGQAATELNDGCPLLGVTLTRKGRAIDGLTVYAAQWDPDQLTEPLVAVTRLKRITEEKDASGGITFLSIEADDGSGVTLELSGPNHPECPRELVEKIAYTAYEQRGCIDGYDLDDWLRAEQVIHEVKRELVV